MYESEQLRQMWANKAQEGPPDPTASESVKKAVFVGQQATNDTIIVGDDSREEWLVTADMSPLSLEEVR
jgi:hypothetical protein